MLKRIVHFKGKGYSLADYGYVSQAVGTRESRLVLNGRERNSEFQRTCRRKVGRMRGKGAGALDILWSIDHNMNSPRGTWSEWTFKE